jgi:hypothetical protein
MVGVAGANIANAAGAPASGGSAWTSAVIQFPLGGYVQDALDPAADTNYIGVDVGTSYEHNVLAEGQISPTEPAPQPNWLVPVDDNPARGGTAQWVKNGATALIPGDKVTVALGAATKDNSTGTHNVFATVPANYFFWAVTAATT